MGPYAAPKRHHAKNDVSESTSFFTPLTDSRMLSTAVSITRPTTEQNQIKMHLQICTCTRCYTRAYIMHLDTQSGKKLLLQ